jgi:FAD/FMN-containing dehydrogenase
VFHAGDGNLHPLICFDSRFEDEVRRVKEAGRELMEVCVAAGGSITGEHGVGLDKRDLLPLVFSEADMNAMLSVRAAFDPLGLCNPGKIIPMLRGCGEARAISVDAVCADRLSTDSLSTDRPSTDPLSTDPLSTNPLSTNPLSSNLDFAPLATTPQSPVPTGLAPALSPDSTEEIVEIIKRAAAERWTVTPVGGKTLLRGDPSSNLIINTNRLDQIIEHEPADLIAIAQPGVTLNAFNQALAEKGQWLPLDPPNDGRATLGGIVATGLGGAQQFGYGRPRGSVIGMTVVLADGNVIKAGGRVVKNVAGYDLCKLFTGSYGTLGIITELIFKLRPRPAREATVIATGSIANLLNAGHKLINARLFPVAVELVSSAFSKRIELKGDEPTLLVRFAGNEKGVAYQVEQALVHLKNSTVKTMDVVNEDSVLWQSVAAIPVKESTSYVTRVLPSQLGTLITTFDRGALWQAGVGDGRIRTAKQVEPNTELINPVSQRIKQQLDPFNLFRGHDHDHAT